MLEKSNKVWDYAGSLIAKSTLSTLGHFARGGELEFL